MDSANGSMYIIFPKSGISSADETAVRAAINEAVEHNPDLSRCIVKVRHSWTTRTKAGKPVKGYAKSYVIQFYRRVKALHIDRLDPDTPEEIEMNKDLD